MIYSIILLLLSFEVRIFLNSNIIISTALRNMKVRVSCSVMPDSLWSYELYPARFLCPWNSPGKSTSWNGLPLPSPWDLPDPGTESWSPALQEDYLLFEYLYVNSWLLEKAIAPHSSTSCLENPMDRGTWEAVVYGVAKSLTWLSDFAFTFHFHTLEKERATHSSVLAWRIPGMVEPGGLPSMGSHRVGHD